jgi:hypothetical protein
MPPWSFSEEAAAEKDMGQLSTNMPVAGTNSESDIDSDGPPHDKTGTFGNGGHSAILP